MSSPAHNAGGGSPLATDNLTPNAKRKYPDDLKLSKADLMNFDLPPLDSLLPHDDSLLLPDSTGDNSLFQSMTNANNADVSSSSSFPAALRTTESDSQEHVADEALLGGTVFGEAISNDIFAGKKRRAGDWEDHGDKQVEGDGSKANGEGTGKGN
jgi:hypothetical protein